MFEIHQKRIVQIKFNLKFVQIKIRIARWKKLNDSEVFVQKILVEFSPENFSERHTKVDKRVFAGSEVQ